MKKSDPWSKGKSDFSQKIDSFVNGKSDAAETVKQLELLLSEYNLDKKSEDELKSIINLAALPEQLVKQLLNVLAGEKKRHIQEDTPTIHLEVPVSESSDGHPTFLQKILQQGDNNRQTVPIKSGQTIRDTYTLVCKIGKGGMGQVWKAVDLIQDAGESKDKYVAIKLINHELRNHPDVLKALVREFARYKKLIHPNIVKAYELNRDENEVFIAMEYLEGGELKEFIQQHPQGIPLQQAQPIIKAMCDALDHAHHEGIIHLDFKPGNVFYNPKTDVCKVIDFGIARLSSQQARDETRFDPGTLGAITTAYASCEMLMGTEPDARDDIYGLACVTYELLAGHHPFEKNLSLKAERDKIKPKRIAGLNKGEFQALMNGLNFYRERRTSGAKEFYDELFSPQLLVKQKRSKTLIISAIIAASLIIVPFALYKTYKNWQLDEIRLGIQKKVSPGLDSFTALAIDEQQQLLDTPTFSLALVEYITSQKDPADDALNRIAQFKPAIQHRIFADRNVQQHLITYFSDAIDDAIEQDDFPHAEQLSQRILQYYPDSLRLVKQSHAIQPQKQKRLATIQKKFQQCLANNTTKFTEVFPCLQTIRIALTKIDKTHVLLKSPELASRYNKEISSAIKKNQLSTANTLLSQWHKLEPDDIKQRTELTQKLAYAKKRNDLVKQINTSNNTQITQFFTVLPTLPQRLTVDVLNNSTVKQRLMDFYQQSVSQYLADNNFAAAATVITDGIALFSKGSKEQNKLKKLAQKTAKIKVDYLAEQKNHYNKQLSQQKPEIKIIQDIQKNVSAIAPDNPLIQLPGLSENYAKKIDVAIMQDQYVVAQGLLDDWKVLKPAAADSSEFIQLSDKRVILLHAFENRKKASAQLQEALKSKQLIKINTLIIELKKQFFKQDQQKIFSPYQAPLIEVYQQHIDTAIQQDAFVSATKIVNQITDVFPKNAQLLSMKSDISKAKTLRCDNLLAESKTAINADILDGDTIFSPLRIIQSIDTAYLEKHLEIFKLLKQKLIKTVSFENPVPELKNVINHWRNFITKHTQQSVIMKEEFRKTKNLIALRCLFNGRMLKKQNKKTVADELFMFGLSLDPTINPVRSALEKEILE